jgi:Ca2+/H+ antiporter
MHGMYPSMVLPALLPLLYVIIANHLSVCMYVYSYIYMYMYMYIYTYLWLLRLSTHHQHIYNSSSREGSSELRYHVRAQSQAVTVGLSVLYLSLLQLIMHKENVS